MTSATAADFNSSAARGIPLNRLLWVPPALLLISAALTKSLTPLSFLNELANYGLPLPLPFQAILTLILPALEMFLGMMLLMTGSRHAAGGSLVLLAGFTGGIIIALPTGYLQRCGCLGPETVNPILALIKNGLAMALLIFGFRPSNRLLQGANPWAAFAFISGASWTGSGMLVIYALGALLASFSGRRHVMGYLLSLLLGLVLHLAHFPLVAAIVVGTVLYFIHPERNLRTVGSSVLVTVAVLFITTACMIWPLPPEAPRLLLKIGQPWPIELQTESPFPRDAQGRTFTLFLRADCDECRDWMPYILRLYQRDDLSPLVGLAPQPASNIEVYRRREGIPFNVHAVAPRQFDQAVRRTPMLVELQNDTVKVIFKEGWIPEMIPPAPLNKGGNIMSTSVDSNRVTQDFSPGLEAGEQPVVIWVTGGLHGEYLPVAPYGAPLAGGVSRIARALDLYRRPGDLLVDLGQFRYPKGVSGETREWRLRANGLLKTMARMKYSAINITAEDELPSPSALAALGREYGLPLHYLGAGILITDVSEDQLDSLVRFNPNARLILWLNAGKPVAREVGGVVVLGMGDSGNCLGRIEIRSRAGNLSLQNSDVSGWTDGQPWAHHPAREELRQNLSRSEKPKMSAYLWQVPEALSPQKQAEAQHNQTVLQLSDYYDLKELHRKTPSYYAGPELCRKCHSEPHPRDFAQEHATAPESVLSYPVYERCLSCHATGFNESGGFLEPTERPDLLAVTCEACHGSGIAHAQTGGFPVPPKPDSTVCQECHEGAKRPGGHP